MFSSNCRDDNSSLEYNKRIQELETELKTARQFIEDQQQILKANLTSLADEAERPQPPAAETAGSMSFADQPPVPMTEFGAPVADIAQRVLHAAEARSRSAPPETGEPAVALPQGGSGAPSPLRSRPGPSPHVVTTALLLFAVLVAAVWTRGPWSGARGIAASGPSPRSDAAPATTDPTALPKVERVESAMTGEAAAAPEHKQDTGPILEPIAPRQGAVTRVTAPPAAVVAEVPRVPRRLNKKVAAQNVPPKFHRVERVVAKSAHPPVKSDRGPRSTPASSRPKAYALHRRVTPAGQPARRSAPLQQAFNREIKQHPQPGWDEEDDKWLDRF